MFFRKLHPCPAACKVGPHQYGAYFFLPHTQKYRIQVVGILRKLQVAVRIEKFHSASIAKERARLSPRPLPVPLPLLFELLQESDHELMPILSDSLRCLGMHPIFQMEQLFVEMIDARLAA